MIEGFPILQVEGLMTADWVMREIPPHPVFFAFDGVVYENDFGPDGPPEDGAEPAFYALGAHILGVPDFYGYGKTVSLPNTILFDWNQDLDIT